MYSISLSLKKSDLDHNHNGHRYYNANYRNLPFFLFIYIWNFYVKINFKIQTCLFILHLSRKAIILEYIPTFKNVSTIRQ